MPKIFLIKNRLHQQQLRLLESQNLIQAKNEDRLNIEDSSQPDQDDREPLSLVAKKRNTEDNSETSEKTVDDFQQKNESGELREEQNFRFDRGMSRPFYANALARSSV